MSHTHPAPSSSPQYVLSEGVGAPIRVSVVIPMYNGETWIVDALRSVVRQTYPQEDIEILVVDDGSDDAGGEIAASFLERQRLTGRVLARGRNAGVSEARNLGWREANGAWIQFLDADDLLVPGKLQTQVAYAAQAGESTAVIYSDWCRLRFRGGQWRPTGALVRSYVDTDTVIRILTDPDFGFVGPMLFRKSFLSVVEGFDDQLSLAEDLDLSLRIAMAGGQFARAESDGATFLYRQVPNSLGMRGLFSPEALQNRNGIFRRAEVFLRNQAADGQLSDSARSVLAQRYAPFVGFLDDESEYIATSVRQIHNLGLPYPPTARKPMRAVAKAIGYKKALHLKSLWLRQVRRPATLATAATRTILAVMRF